MAQLDVEQLERDYKQQYVRLLDLLARIIYANKDLTVRDVNDYKRLDDAHALAFKFFGHALTVLYLSHGTNQELPSLNWDTVDSASIDVLTRATMEAFLVFHYVFYAPETKEEKDYRYWTYRAEGLANRQIILESVGSEKEKRELMAEKKELGDKLCSNRVSQSLTNRQQNQIFKGNSMWRWNSGIKKVLGWHDIAINAGFSKFLAEYIYNFLCASAHSTSIGVRQTFPTHDKKEEEHLFAGTVAIMNIITANLIREYCELCSRAQTVLNGDIKANNLITEWIQKGSTLDKIMGAQVGA